MMTLLLGSSRMQFGDTPTDAMYPINNGEAKVGFGQCTPDVK